MRNMFVSSVCTGLFSFFVSSYCISQERLEEVIVVSSKTQMPLREVGSSVSVIEREELTLRGYTQVSEVLRTQVGVSVSNTGGIGKPTAIRLRGEEGYRTLILIDGVEVSDPTGTQVGPQSQILSASSDINRIEILRGPQGFIYGADAGGVISISTLDVQEGLQAQVSADIGRYNTKNYNGYIAAGADIGSIFISASDQSTDGFNSRPSDATGDEDGNENTTVHTKFTLNITDNIQSQLVLRSIDARSEFDNCFPASNNCESTARQDTGKLSFKFNSQSASHHAAISNTDVDRESITDGTVGFETSGHIKKLEYLYDLNVHERLGFVVGADIKEEAIDGDMPMDRKQKAVFFETQTLPVDKLAVTFGARYDDNDDFGEHLVFRVTSAYLLPVQGGDEMKFRASLGNGFRAPSLAEIAYNNGPFAFGDAAGLALQEETSSGIDIGYDYFFKDKGSIELTYFYQKIEDEIFFDLASFQGYLQSEGKSASKGLEAAITYPINNHIEIVSNLTYNKTTNVDGDTRIRRPEKIFNLGTKFTGFNNALNILVNIRSARNSVNEVFGEGRVELEDYTVVDVSANYTVNPMVQLYGRIENVGDKNYQEVTDFNTSGEAVYAGVRLSF